MTFFDVKIWNLNRTSVSWYPVRRTIRQCPNGRDPVRPSRCLYRRCHLPGTMTQQARVADDDLTGYGRSWSEAHGHGITTSAWHLAVPGACSSSC